MDRGVDGVLCCDRIARNIVVVVDATTTWMSHTMNDILLLSLQKLQNGDSLILFGILESLLHPTLSMLETLDFDPFIGAIRTRLEERTSYVKQQCEKQGVSFWILIKPGPLDQNKATLEEMMSLATTSISLDKTMGKYKSFLSKALLSKTLAKQKDGVTKCMSSPQELQATYKSTSSALSACEGVMAIMMHKSPLTEYGIERINCALDSPTDSFPTEISWGSSAPISARSSLGVWPSDYEGIWADDGFCEGSTVPSARSSFSITPYDIASSSADNLIKNLYCSGTSGEHQSMCTYLDEIDELGPSPSGASSSRSFTTQSSKVLDITCLTLEPVAPSLPAQAVSVRPRRLHFTPNLVEVLEQAADREEASNFHTGHPNRKDPHLCIPYSTSAEKTYSGEPAKNPRKVVEKGMQHSGACSTDHATFQKPQAFRFEDLKIATNNFSQQNLLNTSYVGLTFKGSLADGQTVIVKENKLASCQLDEQFVARVQLLGGLHHQNIVSIIGACKEKGLFVYEHVDNESLYWHIAMSSPVTMNWHVRYKVALGIAKGLKFLHEGSQHAPITHGNLNSKNILLTNDYVPKIADAGLKWRPDGMRAETCVIGAPGCLAPEYLQTGIDTPKTDIFAYGVILLELITGLKASSRPNKQDCLTKWAQLLIKEGERHKLMDMRIKDSIVEKQLCTATDVALLCIDEDPATRPEMSQVVQILEQSMELDGNKSHIVSAKPPLHRSPKKEGDYASSSAYNARAGHARASSHTYHQPSQQHRRPNDPQHLASFYPMLQQRQLPWQLLQLRPCLPRQAPPHARKDSLSHEKVETSKMMASLSKGKTVKDSPT